MITKGQTLTQFFKVEESHTAIALGSGDLPVLSTPYMIACMENTAMNLLGSTLEKGNTSVGIFIKSQHMKASKIGEKITYSAVVTEIDGRKVSFGIEAYNEEKILIGKCSHDRFIVDIERFMNNI